MRILLIQPDTSERMVGFTAMVRPEPLALEMIAAMVPEHEVKILDLRIDPSLEETLSSFRPELVGVTGYTTDVPRMRQICSLIKEHREGVTTMVGGYHATLCPHDFDRPFIDVIVLGEGEITFKELVTALAEKRDLEGVKGIMYRRGHLASTGPRPLVRDLDELPLPARHLTNHYRPRYHFHFWEDPYLIETARGCPYRCTFCAVWKFHHGRCRFRAPERVLEDLKTMPSRVVCFVDDNFFQRSKRVERLYELIKANGLRAQYWMQARSDSIVRHPDIVKKWAEIGLDSVLIGFEKINEEDLKRLNKRSSVKANEKAIRILQENGMDIWGMFIVDPEWTEADFDALIEYVHKQGISFPTFTILTPIPGTAFFQEKLKELRTLNYEVFDFLHTVLPTRLTLEEFYCHFARLYANTTMGLRELKERVKSGRIPSSALARVRDILKDVTNPQAYLRSLEQPYKA